MYLLISYFIIYLILISDVNYEFVIEERTSDNPHFSRGFFMSNGASMRKGSVMAVENRIRCINDTIYFRVS